MLRFHILIQAVLAAFWAAAPLCAQSVRGRVSDPQGVAVEGAQVQILGWTQTSFTNQEGGYSFEGVPAGRYTMRVTSQNFEPLQTAVEVPAGQTAEVMLQFKQIRAAITSVEVLGESAEALLEKPGSVFLVTRGRRATRTQWMQMSCCGGFPAWSSTIIPGLWRCA
jgi:hypothetical protein